MRSLEEDKSKAKEKFRAYLKRNSMRQTSERFLILDVIYSMPSSFEVKDICDKINADLRVSRATVYSTLEILQECKLVIRHSFNTKVVRYEKMPVGANFYYRVCTECNTIKPFSDQKLKKSIALRNSKAFSALSHTLYIYGICKKCRGKKIGKKL